jgi:hypothetical protein
MMKFRDFLKKRKAKTTASKSAEQSAHQNLEPHNQVRANDNRVLLGTDDSELASALIQTVVKPIT